MTDSQAISSVPLMRKLWVVVTLTILLLTFPIAMLILLTGPVYRWRDHGWRPISNRSRYVYGGLLALWLGAVIVRGLLFPELMKKDIDEAVTRSAANAPIANVATPRTKPSAAAGSSEGKSASEGPQTPSPPQESSPNMNVSIAPPDHGGQKVVITADDDEPFIIQRVVFNGRDGEDDCDMRPIEDPNQEQTVARAMSTTLPSAPLKRGDRASFVSICGTTMRVAIYTDHGVARYQMDK